MNSPSIHMHLSWRRIAAPAVRGALFAPLFALVLLCFFPQPAAAQRLAAEHIEPGRQLCQPLPLATHLGSTAAITPTSTFFPLILNLQDRSVSSADDGHVCVITKARGVQCWGNNQNGQLGSGASSDYEVAPVDVIGLDEPVSVIATGVNRWGNSMSCTRDHAVGWSCAVSVSGRLACWGANGRENGAIYTVLSSGVTDAAIGALHGCALLADKTVQCWGENSRGELGDGTTSDRPTPAPVVGINGPVIDIAADSEPHAIGHSYVSVGHTCALLESGDVQCWGDNIFGQLGRPAIDLSDINNRSTQPLIVPEVGGQVVQIETVQASTCALTRSGEVKCWGLPFTATPQTIEGVDTPIRRLFGLCGLDVQGKLVCWNDYARRGAEVMADAPENVATYTIADSWWPRPAGMRTECLTTLTGGVWCKGSNIQGELGNGQGGVIVPQPVNVYGLDAGATSVTAGADFSCSLMGDGQVRCWGDNIYGQLGNGTLNDSTIPTRTEDIQRFVQIDSGDNHSCARTYRGSVFCWGANRAGQLGVGPTVDSTIPLMVTGISGPVSDVAAGGGHTCAVIEDGSVQCWGPSGLHQVSAIDSYSQTTPLTQPGLAAPAQAVVAGSSHTCALLAGGAVQCWGGNQYGQLGIGSTSISETAPVTVTGLISGVKSLAAGANHTCAAMDSGKVQCWGVGAEGVFTRTRVLSEFKPTVPVQPTPQEVAGIDNALELAAGGSVKVQYEKCRDWPRDVVVAPTCALTTSGAVLCWSMGQTTPPTTPLGLEQGVRSIALGDGHSCAVMDTGGVRCWGKNDQGQVGNANPVSPFWVRVTGY